MGLCAACYSPLEVVPDAGTSRYSFVGEPAEIAARIAEASQGGMIIIPQGTFRQLPLELLSEHCLVRGRGTWLEYVTPSRSLLLLLLLGS